MPRIQYTTSRKGEMLLRKVHNVVCACEVPTEVRRNINRVCAVLTTAMHACGGLACT